MHKQALVLIAGNANNYFYNLCGRRLAESLHDLSFEVDIATLADLPSKTYDWCVLANISEVASAVSDNTAALEKLRRLKKSCKVMTSAGMECVGARWFRLVQELTRAVDIQSYLDIGLHDQGEHLPRDARSTYYFLENGLTTTELRNLDEHPLDDQRTIPWAFIGHQTPERAAFVDYLVQHIDPGGFVYLPQLHSPCLETGSPHINQEQFNQVLRHTRYQMWCSHHDAFYMECERFRMSLLAGGVPVKVLYQSCQRPPEAPFPYLMIEARDLAERWRSFDFHEVRRRFRNDFRQIKPLKTGLAEFLAAVSVIDRHEIHTCAA